MPPQWCGAVALLDWVSIAAEPDNIFRLTSFSSTSLLMIDTQGWKDHIVSILGWWTLLAALGCFLNSIVAISTITGGGSLFTDWPGYIVIILTTGVFFAQLNYLWTLSSVSCTISTDLPFFQYTWNCPGSFFSRDNYKGETNPVPSPGVLVAVILVDFDNFFVFACLLLI